jgi:hypothetical protein
MLREFVAGAHISQNEPPSSPKTAPQSSDRPVKTFLDYVALALILEAGSAFWRGENITRVFAGLVGGAVVLVAHYKWEWLKVQLGKRFEETAISVATDFKWWLAPILLLLLYVAWPIFAASVVRAPSSVTQSIVPSSHGKSRRSQIREQLAVYIGQDEAMQATCEDERSRVPNVSQWKTQVEQFLETLATST